MTIKVGDKVPEVTVMMPTSDGPKPITTTELFKGKTVAFFAVPGAFTPTCSAKHLPGFIDHNDKLKAKGVDEIVCMSVNDAFVMGAWGKASGADGKVTMIGDGNGELTRALGLTLDGSKFGLGERSQRFSAVIKDGVVTHLNVDEGGAFKVSSAEHMLEQL